MPRKFTGIVPERWRRRADEPLGNAVDSPKSTTGAASYLERFKSGSYCEHRSLVGEKGIGTMLVLRHCMCGLHRDIPVLGHEASVRMQAFGLDEMRQRTYTSQDAIEPVKNMLLDDHGSRR